MVVVAEERSCVYRYLRQGRMERCTYEEPFIQIKRHTTVPLLGSSGFTGNLLRLCGRVAEVWSAGGDCGGLGSALRDSIGTDGQGREFCPAHVICGSVLYSHVLTAVNWIGFKRPVRDYHRGLLCVLLVVGLVVSRPARISTLYMLRLHEKTPNAFSLKPIPLS